MQKLEQENYIQAGKIASQVVAYAKSIIKPNMLLIDIAEKVEAKTFDLGGKPAFPINLSINEIAAHYTPSSKDTTKAQGLLCVDIGVEVEGFIADTAFSLDLTENNEFKEIIKLNQEALDSALSIIKPNTKVNEIGNAIQARIKGTKYSVIRNLSGHALGENMIHAGLTISNYTNSNTSELNDIAIAIEPFLTEGAGEVYESSNSEIFMLQSDQLPRDRDARKILEFIKLEYNTRPFCKRWIEKKGFSKVSFSLSIMEKQGILHNYPVLIEKSKKPVSQFEHTVLIADKAIVTTR